MKSNLICLISLLCFISCAQKKSKTPSNYTYEIVVPDINIPWGFAFLPDNSILITEKSGVLIHFKNDSKSFIKELPEIIVQGQGGLMDIELHPNYPENGWVYISYASSDGTGKGANTSIMRFKIQNKTAIEKQLLYKATPNSGRGQHFGSRLEFDNDGFLYFSIGDRGNRDINPQNIERGCPKRRFGVVAAGVEGML